MQGLLGRAGQAEGEDKGLEMQEQVQRKLEGSLSRKYILKDEQEKVHLEISEGNLTGRP